MITRSNLNFELHKRHIMESQKKLQFINMLDFSRACLLTKLISLMLFQSFKCIAQRQTVLKDG